jgi:hypothetical protein
VRIGTECECRADRGAGARRGNVFDRDAFTIDWERQQVVCPPGKLSREWSTPLSITPYVRVKFAKEDCGQCPVKSSCTRSDRRQLNFLPQQLYERQAAARAAQQTTPWKANYAMRAGIESTVNEFVHATSPLPQPDQDPRPARPHAIAVNTERVNADPTTPTADRQPRTLTALQNFLDRHRIPRPTAWRIAGKS